MLAVAVFLMGQLALLACLRPFLKTMTRVDVSTLSVICFPVKRSRTLAGAPLRPAEWAARERAGPPRPPPAAQAAPAT